MIISIASGKGGTGKTTVALILAAARTQSVLVDCDVEAPNCHLFLKPSMQHEQSVKVMVPAIDAAKCTACGACARVCRFNALAVAGQTAMLFSELCHGCGGCVIACPAKAITEDSMVIGVMSTGVATSGAVGTRLIQGTLKIGVPMAAPIIKEIKRNLPTDNDVILDCPPGTSCAMVAGVEGSDFCLLVTEPTPFGRHDLELAIGVAKLLNIPVGVVINKSDNSEGDASIAELCNKTGVKVLAKIPHSRQFAAEYSNGVIAPDFTAIGQEIWEQIKAGAQQ